MKILQSFALLAIVLLLSTNSLSAQFQFSDTIYMSQIKELYANELRAYADIRKQQAEGKTPSSLYAEDRASNDDIKIPADSLIMDFELRYATMSDERRLQLVEISNFMYKTHAKPGIQRLMYSVNGVAANFSEGNFKVWFDYFLLLSKTKNVLLSDVDMFLKQTAGLAYRQQIYTSKVANWYTKSKSVTFTFDKAAGVFQISIPSTNIYCVNQGDTLEIQSTGGTYSPTELKWKGSGGMVVWDNNMASAKFKEYIVDLQTPEYTAKNAEFKHTKYLPAPVLGTFTDKASPWAEKNDAYPDFLSQDKRLNVKGLSENISQIGQFHMKGSSMYVEGTETNPALVQVKRAGKVVLETKSTVFTTQELNIYKKEEGRLPEAIGKYYSIYSKDAIIDILFGKDNSITHQSCRVELLKDSCHIERNVIDNQFSPFLDEYHGLEYHIPAINWTYEKNQINFGQIISLNDNTYEIRSTSYYTDEEMDRLQMADAINPLFDIWDYIKFINKTTKGAWVMEFTMHDYVKHYKKSALAIKSRFIQLSNEGFISYYESTDTVIVRKKLVNWVKHKQGLKDYDNIKYNFGGDKRVFLDLKTNEMVFDGVESVVLSNNMKTGIVPEGVIRVGANRKMYFDGHINAGEAVVSGKGFVFDYDSLQIRSSKIEVMHLKNANSTIEGFSGRIYIAKKGFLGLEDTLTTADYPKVVAETPSKVFYDKNNKQGDVYKRENFYFTADPFTLSGLTPNDIVTFYKKINLPGQMKTGGIVPDFRENLKMMTDNSLGFVHQVPDGSTVDLFKGMATLKGDGKSSATVSMSNQGLEAGGQVDWLTATILAKDFMFQPKKVTATADSYTIKENLGSGAKYPQVSGEKIDIKWDTDAKKMVGTTLDKPLDMFDKRSTFKGETTYSPNDFTGKGEFTTDEGYFKSDNFSFEARTLTSANTNFTFLEGKTDLTSDKPQEVALRATEMLTYTDMDKGKTVLQSATDKALVTLPKTEYEFSPSHMIWKHKKHAAEIDYHLSYHTNRRLAGSDPMLLDSVHFVSKKLLKLGVFNEQDDRTEYTSIKAGQQRLNFKARRAKFDGITHTLTTEKVKTIAVADIVVNVREGDDVILQKGAKMNTLIGTTVTALKHTIHKVDINILGKNEYVASAGIYHYFYPEREDYQEINFNKIKYDAEKKASVAEADIVAQDSLMLNDYFQYLGKVHFNATKDLLTMEGFARIQPFCDQRRMWFNFTTEIRPDSVVLPLEDNPHAPVEVNSARTFANIMYAKDSIYIFPAFLANDPYSNSGSMYSVGKKGNFVRYNKNRNTYQISTPERLKGINELDDAMDFNTKNCEINAFGKFNFEALNYLEMDSYTRYRHELQSNKISIRTFTTTDFFFNNQMLKTIADTLANMPNAGLPPTDEMMLYGLNREIGVAGTAQFMAEQSLGMGKKFPDSLNHTIVFSQLVLDWNQNSESFKSKGELGILSMGDKYINRTVKGYVRIKKGNTATGDYVDIYLEPKPDVWFYFKFTPTRMTTGSSSKEYYQIYKSLKSKDLKDPTGRTYGYTDGDTERNMFIYEFTGEYPK